MIETISSRERNWAMCSHLLGLLIFTHIPFANVIGPLVLYIQVRGEKMPFATEHAKAALDFQITFSLAMIVGFIVGLAIVGAGVAALAVNGDREPGPPLALIAGVFVLVSLLLLGVLANVVCCILGAIAASGGHRFRYPLAIPFVR
jgi:hypothetical protein